MSVVLLALLLDIVSGGTPLAWHDYITPDLANIDHQAAFSNWQFEFGKQYASDEELLARYAIFEATWKIVNDHNIAHSQGLTNWTMGLNQFSDLTTEEFIDYVGCLTPHKEDTAEVDVDVAVKISASAPKAIDWTNVNGSSYVTPVKNQEQCGSCWAFSATGSLESFSAIANNWTGSQIIELSEQQLVDCTYALPDGCQGGLQEDAFSYITKEGGLCTEKEYPYTAHDGTCMASSCGTKYDKITGYKTVSKKSESALMTAIAEGPIAVSVDANGVGWQSYKSGVYDNACGTSLDHGVLGVGYGTASSGGDYWKIKNSWGKSWGMEGYILICRNCGKNGNSGECGILLDNTYPTL